MIDFVKYLCRCVAGLFATPEGRVRANITAIDDLIGISVILFVLASFVLIKRIVGKIKKNKINQNNEPAEYVQQEEILHPESYEYQNYLQNNDESSNFNNNTKSN